MSATPNPVLEVVDDFKPKLLKVAKGLQKGDINVLVGEELRYVNAFLLGIAGIIAFLQPGIVTGLYGAGFGNGHPAADFVRFAGVQLLTISCVALSAVSKPLMKAMLVFWAGTAFTNGYLAIYSTLGYVGMIGFFVCAPMAFFQAREAGYIK